MHILSWNVNGIRAAVKKDFVKSIRAINPDVICLQETKATPEQVREALFELAEYEVVASSAERKGYSGTAVLSRVPFAAPPILGMGVPEHDNEGRLIATEFDALIVVNAYVPNSGNGLVRLDYRAQWDRDLRTYLNALRDRKPVLFCGDLNVAHQPIDLARPKSNYNKTAGYTQREIDGFSSMLASGWVDVYRSFYPDSEAYTWWSYRMGAREKNIGWRLDYFIASEQLMHRIGETIIHSEILGSDHCPISVKIK